MYQYVLGLLKEVPYYVDDKNPAIHHYGCGGSITYASGERRDVSLNTIVTTDGPPIIECEFMFRENIWWQISASILLQLSPGSVTIVSVFGAFQPRKGLAAFDPTTYATREQVVPLAEWFEKCASGVSEKYVNFKRIALWAAGIIRAVSLIPDGQDVYKVLDDAHHNYQNSIIAQHETDALASGCHKWLGIDSPLCTAGQETIQSFGKGSEHDNLCGLHGCA